MSRAARIVLGAMLTIAPLVGCSLLVDTSGLAGGGGETSDAADDFSRSDGANAEGSTSDGGLDAPGTDAAPKCIDGPTRFCDDFEEANPGAKWTRTDKKRGALAFDSLGPASPHSLSAKLFGGGGEGAAALEEDFAGFPGNVRCAFDLKLADVPGNSELHVFELVTTIGSQTHHVYFARFGATWSIAEYQEALDGGAPLDRSTDLGGALPTDTWFNVVIDATPTTVTLTANSVSAKLDALSTPTGTTRSLVLGIPYAAPAITSASLFIDNLDCTLAP